MAGILRNATFEQPDYDSFARRFEKAGYGGKQAELDTTKNVNVQR
jgi:hypothetical protein